METIVLILLILLILILSIFFLIPWFFGAPYDVTRKVALNEIVNLANPKKGDVIAELGSGDGRILIKLARKNKDAKIIGFEINPFLVIYSRLKIKKIGLDKQVKVHWRSFWKVNLSKFNKIIFFQFASVTRRLEKKFRQELKAGSVVISHNWRLPSVKPKKVVGKRHLSYGEVYLYEF